MATPPRRPSLDAPTLLPICRSLLRSSYLTRHCNRFPVALLPYHSTQQLCLRRVGDQHRVETRLPPRAPGPQAPRPLGPRPSCFSAGWLPFRQNPRTTHDCVARLLTLCRSLLPCSLSCDSLPAQCVIAINAFDRKSVSSQNLLVFSLHTFFFPPPLSFICHQRQQTALAIIEMP